MIDLDRSYALNICRLIECDIRDDVRISLSRVIQKFVKTDYSK